MNSVPLQVCADVVVLVHFPFKGDAVVRIGYSRIWMSFHRDSTFGAEQISLNLIMHNNIYRIDIEATPAYPNRHPTHGWQVRIRRQGTQHTKFFSDEKFGGRDQALAEAQAYRDHLILELPEPANSVEESARARSRTGVVGLNFCNKDDGSGKQKPYIQLSWLNTAGQRKSASYSVDKWGLRRAVWNACTRLHREKDDPSLDPYTMFKTAYQQIVGQHPHLDDGEPVLRVNGDARMPAGTEPGMDIGQA
jgi:hypothetical protein